VTDGFKIVHTVTPILAPIVLSNRKKHRKTAVAFGSGGLPNVKQASCQSLLSVCALSLLGSTYAVKHGMNAMTPWVSLRRCWFFNVEV
jgi:hypothetical protein